MLTSDEISALKEYAGRLMDNVNKYLIADISQRIANAGEITTRVQYEIYLAQTLGVEYEKIQKEVARLLKVSENKINGIFTLASKTAYLNQVAAFGDFFMPFEDNETIQQITRSMVNLATGDFKNITQTLGMVDREGNELPLKEFYNKVMDDVFTNVSTGAMDYNTAVRQASNALAIKGVTAIGYQSGVKTSLEAAVRRNIMGGLGLMVEDISQYSHDALQCDGWEMSAHEGSAKDHEPLQGKQYTDKEWLELNGTPEAPGKLKRRIGTLNCGHSAFPIIIGVNQPKYTEEELKAMAERNAKGVTVDDKHYTVYEAHQHMRSIERSIRRQKKRVIAANATKIDKNIHSEYSRLNKLREEYADFAKKSGLRTQEDRLYVEGYGHEQVKFAKAATKRVNNMKNDI